MKELPETVFYEDFEFDDIDEEEEYDLNGGGDFSEYMWMGEEEDFDRKVEEQLWENELTKLVSCDNNNDTVNTELSEERDLLRFMYEDIICHLDHCTISASPPQNDVKSELNPDAPAFVPVAKNILKSLNPDAPEFVPLNPEAPEFVPIMQTSLTGSSSTNSA